MSHTPKHTLRLLPEPERARGVRGLLTLWVALLGLVGTASAQITFDATPADTSVRCTNIPPMGPLTATSDCVGQITYTTDEQTVPGRCPHNYDLVRTWTAIDQCSRSVTHTQTVSVYDDEPPIVTGVPNSQTVTPGNIPPEPNPGVVDFCDPNPTLQVFPVDSVAGPCGGYTKIYRYIATDACGNEEDYQYVLTVAGQDLPTFSSVPDGRELACGEALPPAPTVTATDSNGDPLNVTLRVDTLGNRGGDTCFVIQRTWSATDGCGFTNTTTQAFTLIDAGAPVLDGVPADTVIYCETLPAWPTVTASDDCAASLTVVTDSITGQTNNGQCTDVTYTIVRSWEVSDLCGNVTRAEQRIEMKCECCDNGIDDDDDGLVDDYDPQCNCFGGVVDECDNTRRYFIPPVWHPTRSEYRQPSELVITTLAPTANIHIMTADGTTYNQTFTVNRGTPLIIPLDAPGTTVEYLQTPNHDQVENNRGWIITSDQLIQPIYRIDGFFNKVLVTIKGPQGMGRVFRAGSQTSTCGTNNMGNGEGHFISVMATEDDTDVTIDFDFPALGGLTGPITRRLQRYETYLIRDDNQNTTVSGSLITATKPIVVTSGSQHTKACNITVDGAGNVTKQTSVAQGMDGGIDQLVPNCLTGDEYVLVKGAGNNVQQYAILVANKNNTRVVRDGNDATAITLQAGESETVYLTGPDYSPSHFRANKPFYMFHVSGISTNNEVGMAIAAPVGECKGDTLIEFPQFTAATASPVRNSVYTILPATGLASLQINGNPWTSCATAQNVPARPDLRAVVFQDACLLPSNSITSDEFFTAGMLVGINRETGTHGYLTAFKDRMSIYDPDTRIETTGYLVDTLCGEQTVSHCIDVASCATVHSIAAVRGGAGTIRLTGGTCFEYTSPETFQGEDEIFVTIKNDQGLFQTVCIRYYICGEPPVVQFPFLDTTVVCDDIPPLTNPLASDECGMNVYFDTEEVIDDGACEFSYVINRHWTIWDDCGDSTRATQIIRVADTTAPISLTIRDTTIQLYCAGIPDPPVVDYRDNCDNSFNYSYEQVTLDSVCPFEKTIQRTWEAWDNCGNRSTAVHRIEVRDTVGPALQILPPSLELTCGEAAAQPQVILTPGCDTSAVIVQDSVVEFASCDTIEYIVRTWTATDVCGRVGTASQTIVVRDTAPPAPSMIPADVQLRCSDPLPTDAPTFTDDCGNAPTVIQRDSVAEPTCPELELYYRIWEATDGCGKTTRVVQRVAVEDLAAPVITPIPADTLAASCADSVIFVEPAITDDCDFQIIRQDSFWSATCNTERYVRRTYTAIDSCGNSETYQQVYYFTDTVPPVWLQEPNDTVLTCGEQIPEMIDINVVDACSGLNAVAVNVRDSILTCPAQRYIFREYVVSDFCNNLDTFVHTIRIDGCEPDIPVLATAVAACTGEDITLTANLDSVGYTTPVYRWEFSPDTLSWTVLAQPADSATLTIANAGPAESGYYRVTVADSVVNLGNPDCSSTSPAIDLRLSDPVATVDSIDLCRGDTLFYLGDTLTASVTRVDTLTTVAGCDSFATLALNVFPFVEIAMDVTLCVGERISFFGVDYDATGVYRDTLITASGCDSTLELNLTVYDDLRDTIPAFLCEGETYLFEGVSHTAAGTYEYPLTSADGCDSTRVLVLTDQDTIRTVIDTTVCPGSGVAAFGQTHFTAGQHTDTLVAASGCDSIVVLNLAVADTSATLLDVTLCQGERYFFGDSILTQAGSYRRVDTSALGCDSAVVAVVTMSPRYDVEIDTQLCVGDFYQNGNYIITEPGRWPLQFYTADGCDSSVYATVSFRPVFNDSVEAFICSGEGYQLMDTVVYDAGSYVRTGPSMFNCDSTVRLRLEVRDPSEHRIEQTLCFGESLEVGSTTYFASALDTITLTNAAGCDSTIYLDLTVNPLADFDSTAVVCYDEVFTIGGNSYTETGVYRDSTVTAGNCDSVFTLYLTRIPEKRDTLEESICAGDSLELGDGTFWSTPGEHEIIFPTASGCDSTLVLFLEVRDTSSGSALVEVCAGEPLARDGRVFTRPDTFRYTVQNAQQCDSTVVLTVVWIEPTYESSDTLVCANGSFDWRGRTITAAGTYRDTLRSRLDCDSIIAINVATYQPDTTRETVDICAGDSVLIAGEYQREAGAYPQIFAGYLGCDSVHLFDLVVHEGAVTRDTVEVCPGETFFFGGEERLLPGEYADTLSTARGCDSVLLLTLVGLDTVTVEVPDTAICRGDTATLRVLTNSVEAIWDFSPDLSCDECFVAQATPDSTTTYTVTGTACDGSAVVATVTVTVYDAVDVEIVATDRLRLGESATLKGITDNPTARLRWVVAGEEVCDECPEYTVEPEETTMYELFGETVEGCADKAQLTITVQDDCAFGEVTVPNFLSPNADGHNDELTITYEGIKEVTLLRIFNRWGELIYETRNIDEAWDGTHRGVLLNPAVFVYYLEGFCLNNEPFRQEGNVTLVR